MQKQFNCIFQLLHCNQCCLLSLSDLVEIKKKLSDLLFIERYLDYVFHLKFDQQSESHARRSELKKEQRRFI